MKNDSKIEIKLLHYTGKAIADYNMIQSGDKVLACLSGGKDSFAMVNLLRQLKFRSHGKFDLFVVMVDLGLPGWDAGAICAWLQDKQLPYEILKSNVYEIVKLKARKESDSHCMLCSRLRRGIIYSYAKQHGFVKIALGHHRDDLITSLLMSILYTGSIHSMPPKLLTNDKRHVVIRPLAYCQEKDLTAYAASQKFPLVAGNLCEHKENVTRKKVRALIEELAVQNPKVPSNMLHALQSVRLSQLMDKKLWDFMHLEGQVEQECTKPSKENFD
jgi:tRNA 2-thiocytidine biosynthesis protein TtcA